MWSFHDRHYWLDQCSSAHIPVHTKKCHYVSVALNMQICFHLNEFRSVWSVFVPKENRGACLKLWWACIVFHTSAAVLHTWSREVFVKHYCEDFRAFSAVRFSHANMCRFDEWTSYHKQANSSLTVYIREIGVQFATIPKIFMQFCMHTVSTIYISHIKG